jgi:hypothetical protein
MTIVFVIGGFFLYVLLVKGGVKAGLALKRKEIEKLRATAELEIDAQRTFIKGLTAAFNAGFVEGRAWLADFVAEALTAKDQALVEVLARKKRPALAAAQEVRGVKEEKRELIGRVKHLEYLLKTLYEDYPVLGDYETDILNDNATLDLDMEATPDADRVSSFISAEDYKRLKPAERNQLALERWLGRKKSSVEIGRMYERFVGARYETDGWVVEYHGATQGLEDLGRDLICRKGSKTCVVQAKYWAAHKTIHEKHIFQLYGTTFLFGRESGNPKQVKGVLHCTSQVSATARDAAKALEIEIVELAMDRDYAMIKCNINGKDKIYHLPFDQQYDRVQLVKAGERYVKSAAEAERLGFRRAKKWMAAS